MKEDNKKEIWKGRKVRDRRVRLQLRNLLPAENRLQTGEGTGKRIVIMKHTHVQCPLYLDILLGHKEGERGFEPQRNYYTRLPACLEWLAAVINNKYYVMHVSEQHEKEQQVDEYIAWGDND